MTAIDFQAFLDELATVSGETVLPFFRTALSIDNKGGPGGFDPVTAADHAAETAMRTLIRRSFPSHGIIGEEYGEERADAEYVWVLDPIDGTKSFISGMPAWGTLIALLRAGEPVFGMMNQPFIRERFSGDGAKAHYRGPAGARDLRVRACAELAEAVLFTTSPLLMNAGDRELFGRVEQTVRLSRYGGDCYAYCMLAPIISGAGGVITTWDGGAPNGGGRIIAAGDKRLHAAALEMLRG
jgi:myo-inositol-1(or 4)-monophosphatase